MQQQSPANMGVGKNLLLGIQHLFAMFGSTVLVPILTGLDPNVALFTAGVGTLIFHAPSEDQSDAAKNAEIAKLAEKFHVSSGKADWILNAADKTGLPTEDVARMPLDELLKLQQAESVASYTSEGDTLVADEAEGSTLQTDTAKFISLEEAKKI